MGVSAPDIVTPGQPDPGPILPRTKPKESSRTWPWRDRIGLYACWACGLLLCLVMGGILVYMLVRGIQYLRPNLFFESPTAQLDQSKSGGFMDPLVGTFLITTVGILIAFPIGVGTAVWLNEYRRPSWLARAVESGVEVVAGTPTVVLAIFGLIVFQNGIFSFLSFTAAGGAVFGRSFLTAGAMMSLIALPLIVTATRSGLQQIPQHVREASYSLGKTKFATIRRVLLPSCRPSIATGTVLGMGRIIGDTAIVVILLGATLQLQGVGGVPGLSTLRGTGSTLTSYVYNNSPAGEGQSPEKAYAAAFVLLLIVVLLNLIVDRITSREAPQWIR
jgi:phosphate transport system permease protein